MGNRLDKKRQEKLEPKRISSTLSELNNRGFEILGSDDKKIIVKSPEGNLISFFPYSGWFTGKGVKDGRGFYKLIKQLEEQKLNN